AQWSALSGAIRLGHECTHYLTERAFGSAHNNLRDELLADYAGLVQATGGFRADWFLRFMGLEAFPRYREAGRLQNYRGRPPLSDGAFRVLQALLQDAAGHLEHWAAHRPAAGLAAPAVILSLYGLTLEEMAAGQMPPDCSVGPGKPPCHELGA